jgi:flagellar protein FliS
VSYPNPQSAVNAYTQVDVHSHAAYASPHHLIQLLLENTLSKIAVAKSCMTQGVGWENVAKKGENISRAMALVEGLRLGLDKQAGGDIAQNLEDLYDYVERRLAMANAKNDPAILDEVSSLMNEIKSAWVAIGNHPAANPATPPARPLSTNVPAIG